MSRRGRSNARLAALLLALTLGFALPAVAEPPGPPPDQTASPPGPPHGPPPGPRGMHRHGDFIERSADRLGLDEQTRKKIAGIVESVRASQEEREPKLRAAHDRMQELLEADSPDAAAVMAQAEAIGALELASHKDRLMAMLAIRALLTPEQRAELVRIREERHGHEHRGRGPCTRDIERLCSDAEPGHATLECLDAAWDRLSPFCRQLFGGKGGDRASLPSGGPSR